MRLFFLGPGYFEGDDDRNALYQRLHLAESLEPHEVEILELTDLDAPDLISKFKAAMGRADAVVVWLPLRGKLNTVFGELLLLRYEQEWHGTRVTIFAEDGVLDVSSDKFDVMHTSGQIAFLRDLPQHYDLEIFEYSTMDQLLQHFSAYAAGMLDS